MGEEKITNELGGSFFNESNRSLRKTDVELINNCSSDEAFSKALFIA